MFMKEVGDWILLGFTIAATIPYVFANSVVLVFRRRSYFQAQGGVDMILIGSLAGLLWIFSTFVVNDHLKHRTGFFRHCWLWNLVFRTDLGFCLWHICIGLRLHRMYFLFKTRNGVHNSWIKNLLLLPLLLVPALVVSAAAAKSSAFDHVNLDLSKRDEEFCHLKKPWLYGVYFTLVPAYFSGLLVFLYLMRKEMDLVLKTEHRQTCEYLFMAFLIYLLAVSTYVTEGYIHVSGRCFLTFCVCCLVFSHFWVRMGWPVYVCVFKAEMEMDEFEDSLRGPEAGVFRVLSNRVQRVPDEFTSSEGAVWQALEEATEEVLRFKLRIQDLQTEKEELLRRRLRVARQGNC